MDLKTKTRLNHKYDYRSTLEASLRINWKIEGNESRHR